MKNLKKVLSLVLALAMALSLMTAAFAADAGDYKDYNEVTYKEAVDVMTAAGVFNGSDIRQGAVGQIPAPAQGALHLQERRDVDGQLLRIFRSLIVLPGEIGDIMK